MIYNNTTYPLSKENFLTFIESFTGASQDLIKILLEYRSRHVVVQPSQETLAKRLGVTREWVNKVLGRLDRMGIIRKVYRHRMTCTYELHDYFYDEGMLLRLVKHFWIYIGNLFPRSGYTIVSRFSPQFTPYINKDVFIYTPVSKLVDKTPCAPARETKKSIAEMRSASAVVSLDRSASTGDKKIKLPGIVAGMNLPLAVQCDCGAYPEEALSYAIEECEKSSHISNVGAYIKAVAEKYCVAKKIPFYIWKKYKLREMYAAEIEASVDAQRKAAMVERPKYERPAYERKPWVNPEGDIVGRGQRMPECVPEPSHIGDIRHEIDVLVAAMPTIPVMFRSMTEERIKQLASMLSV